MICWVHGWIHTLQFKCKERGACSWQSERERETETKCAEMNMFYRTWSILVSQTPQIQDDIEVNVQYIY